MGSNMLRFVVLISALLVANAMVFPLQHEAAAVQNVDLVGRAEEVPLRGNILPLGTFWLPVDVGTPAKKYNLGISTIDTDTLLIASTCGTCSTTAPKYTIHGNEVKCDTSACSVCFKGSCGFNNTFGFSTWNSGVVVNEKIGIADIQGVNVKLGAILQSGPGLKFGPNITGVLGLALPPRSAVIGGHSVINDLTSSALPNTFSLCLTSNPTFGIGEEVGSNSTFTFTDVVPGGFSDPATNEEIPDGLWTLGLSSLTLKNKELLPSSENASRVVIDSNQTVILLMDEAYKAFAAELQASCSTSTPLVGVCNSTMNIFRGYCFQMSATQLAAFPPLVVTFNGSDPLEFPAKDGYLVVATRPGYYCLNVFAGPKSFSVFGQFFLRKFHTVFDLDNSSVGFAPASTCPKPAQTRSLMLEEIIQVVEEAAPVATASAATWVSCVAMVASMILVLIGM